ncbi:MAG: DNA polymerase III subunit delta [Lachnospira eligens]
MKVISDDIKKGEFKSVYLLYGEEEYLKKQYRDRLKNAIAGDDTMNYSYYDSDNASVKDIIDVCETLPFFAQKRLVIMENTGFLKSSNDELADYIKHIPDYLVVVMVEKDVDKRNKVYKAVDSVGYICEMKPQTTATLEKWIAGLLAKDNLKISREACDLILDKTGAGMDYIRQETEKLVSYCQGRDVVTVEDVEKVCATQTTSHIFDMISAIANKKQQQALDLYYDLLELKEPPMRILYLIVRQFNGILQVKDLMSRWISGKEIASKIGAAPFVVGKYQAQAKYFEMNTLLDALNECAKTEEAVKQGRLNDRLGVELIIIKYSK